MKILVCCPSENLREVLRASLSRAGHEPAADSDPNALAELAAESGALLVEAAIGRRAIALLRNRGFAGKSLLACDSGAEQEATRLQAAEMGADGTLALEPREDLAGRFARAVGGRRRVLVLDEDEIVSRDLTQELEEAGYEVQPAKDVEAAMGLILRRATRPDLVLVDAKLPKVSGPNFCKFLKGNEKFRAIRVLISSADGGDVSEVVRDCGADGHVVKSELLGGRATKRA